MICRDQRGWRALLEHRFGEGAEPAEWPEAAAHLESCASCRRIALDIDPSLLFQRLPEPTATAASEVEAMRQAVAGLRRASARGVVASPRLRFGVRRSARLISLARAAAAAALVVGLGSQVPLASRSTVAPPTVELPPAIAAEASVAALTAGESSGGGSLGVSGDVGRPSARVYQIAYRDMAVVMVVDKSLDL